MPTNSRRTGSLARQILPGAVFDQARQAFAREQYEAALNLARESVDLLETRGDPSVLRLPQVDAPRVSDAVVLWARCLFQLDRFEDYQVLLASAQRWEMVPAALPELDLVGLGFAFKRGEYRRVIQEATDFVDGHRQTLPPILADFLLLRGHCYSNLGDPARALDDAEAAFSLFRLQGKELQSARSANLQGMLKVRIADYQEAERWFRRALELHRKLGMHKNMGGNRLNLGIVNYKRGDLAQAELEFRAASVLLTEVGAQVPLCRANIARGCNLRLQRDFVSARNLLNEALTTAGQLMLAREEALALEFLGDICRDEGKLEPARRYYSRALAIGSSMAPDGDVVLEVLRRQGQCLTLMGRPSEAVTILARSLVLARRLGDRHEEGLAHRALAAAHFALGEMVPAGQHVERALGLLAGVGARFEWGKTSLLQAEILLGLVDGGLAESESDVLEQAWQGALSCLEPFIKAGVDYWVVQARALLSDISRRRTRREKREREGLLAKASSSAGSVVAAPAIVHVSACMRDLIQLSDAFADSDEPVLITGETGTGKELFAARLHEHSRRSSREMVRVNITAIPESMFAREFFGHVRGAFSGADRDGIGLAAKADGGTLFLDEIGELPLELQPQLLRLLQDGTYHAIGDPQQRRVDIRLVAATNADLEELVVQGRFRADLYYRLKILSLKLPPVRERREDTLPLLRHFLSGLVGRQAEPGEFFNPESLELMQQYDWPGNVREIAMVARQARVQMASTGQVCVEAGHLQDERQFFTGPGQTRMVEEPAGLRFDSLNRSRILVVLSEVGGNRAEAARRLGVSRSTLYRHLVKMGLATKVSSG